MPIMAVLGGRVMKYMLFALVSHAVLVACSDSPKPAVQPAIQQEEIYTPMAQGEVIGLVQKNMQQTCEIKTQMVQ